MWRNLHGFSVRWVAVVALLVVSVACGSSGSSDDPQGSLLGPMIETDNGVIQGAHGGGDDGVHRSIAEPAGETAVAFDEVVSNVLVELEGSSGPTVRIS